MVVGGPWAEAKVVGVVVVVLLLLVVVVIVMAVLRRRGRQPHAVVLALYHFPPSFPRISWCPSNMIEATSTNWPKFLLGCEAAAVFMRRCRRLHHHGPGKTRRLHAAMKQLGGVQVRQIWLISHLSEVREG
jgi:hypothetical protein